MLSDIEMRLEEDRDALRKVDIARTVLTRLNEAGDPALRPRRELLKRVVEFEDFSTCWPDDRLEAQGLVAQIQRVINVKDAFTRMQLEREAQVRQNQDVARDKMKRLREKQERTARIRQDLNSLFSVDDPHQRGLRLEPIMNELFKEAGVLVKESFRRGSASGAGSIEQIDGVIELDGNIYLVEMKWLKTPVDVGDVSRHIVRVFSRGECRGLFISYSGYTTAAVEACQESFSRANIILCTLRELVIQLERDGDIAEFLKEKVRSAIVNREPFKEILG